MQSTRMQDYIRALEALEEKKVISVDRSAGNYTAWIIKDPA